MNASSAEYWIGSENQAQHAQEDEGEHAVGEAEERLADDEATHRLRDLLGEVDEALALGRRDELVQAPLDARQRGDEVEREDQHDQDAEHDGHLHRQLAQRADESRAQRYAEELFGQQVVRVSGDRGVEEDGVDQADDRRLDQGGQDARERRRLFVAIQLHHLALHPFRVLSEPPLNLAQTRSQARTHLLGSGLGYPGRDECGANEEGDDSNCESGRRRSRKRGEKVGHAHQNAVGGVEKGGQRREGEQVHGGLPMGR